MYASSVLFDHWLKNLMVGVKVYYFNVQKKIEKKWNFCSPRAATDNSSSVQENLFSAALK